MSGRIYFWHCARCDALLDMHLDHVDPGPRPEHGCSGRCPGTFLHPSRGGCSLRGKTIRHADTVFRIKIKTS